MLGLWMAEPTAPCIRQARDPINRLCWKEWADCALNAFDSNGDTEEVLFSEFWMLSVVKMRGIESCFPLSHSIPRANDRRFVSGIIFVINNGLRLRDAPAA